LVSLLTGGLASFGTAATVLLLVMSAPSLVGAAAEDGKLRPGEFIPQAPPQPAPEATFTDADGKPASLADFKGKPVLVNLWATWCEPCLREMPSLDRLQARLDGRLTVLAVSEDRGGGRLVNPFVAKLGLGSLKIYLDPKSEVARAFGVRGLPTTIVIDADGRVRGRVEGAAEWDSDEMRGVLDPLLTLSSGRLENAANAPAR
jgi:thiol-disulfide isomerase/thioredoxin